MVDDPVIQAFITAALFTIGIFVVMPLASRFIASDIESSDKGDSV